MDKRISIIGGGITGLTTAIALNRKGFSCAVYEQAEALKEVGAGIWLQPNAMRVLDILGLKSEIEKAGSAINLMEITNAQLIPYKKINSEIAKDPYGNKTVGIHRAKLQSILYNKAKEGSTIEMGMKYVSHKEQDGNIQISFENDKRDTDLLLGADGLYSKVRANLFRNYEIRHSHQTCWRGVVKFPLPIELKNKGKESWGKNIRFGFSEIDQENNVYWFAVQKNGDKSYSKEKLASLYKDFHPIISKIILSTKHIHIAELEDLKPMKKWSYGSSCLLGDAAHATTPNMGQGAGQGIEDALNIAHYLKDHNLENSAFKTFELARRKKVNYIVNTSWNIGRIAHSNIGRMLATTLMKVTPESVLRKQMSQLYEIKVDA